MYLIVLDLNTASQTPAKKFERGRGGGARRKLPRRQAGKEPREIQKKRESVKVRECERVHIRVIERLRDNKREVEGLRQ